MYNSRYTSHYTHGDMIVNRKMKKNQKNFSAEQKITTVAIRMPVDLKEFLENYAANNNCDGVSAAARRMLEFFAQKPDSAYDIAQRTGHNTLPNLLDVLLEHFMDQPTEEKIKILTWKLRSEIEKQDNARNPKEES